MNIEMNAEPSPVVASPELATPAEVTLSDEQRDNADVVTPTPERPASDVPPDVEQDASDDQDAVDEHLALSVTEPASASDSRLEVWPLYRIKVGARHRTDMGDLTGLGESIRQIGLLQPVTVTADSSLLCGARRLAAVTVLGWNEVPVCVRDNLPDRLKRLMAEHDENTLRKPFNPVELARLYEELKAEVAADMARRQQATWFGAHPSIKDATGAAGGQDARVEAMRPEQLDRAAVEAPAKAKKHKATRGKRRLLRCADDAFARQL